MKTVDELVLEWTKEEGEKLRDLIEECKVREKGIIENSRACKENLNKLNESLISLFSNSYDIQKNTLKLADELSGIYLHLYSKKTPSS